MKVKVGPCGRRREDGPRYDAASHSRGVSNLIARGGAPRAYTLGPERWGERLIEPSSSWFPPKFPSG
ncbi:hypothetical protein ANTQUA_LOCUS10650 [Anthophora quadrimaculata]